MKKWLQVVATLALAICAIVLVNVQDVKAAKKITSTDGQWEYEADYFNSTCTVTDYFGDAVDLVIPSKIDGLKVTKIDTGDYLYGSSLSSNIISVSMPDTVIEICYGCFYRLENLRTVKFSSKLEEIGSEAFLGCKSLKNVSISKAIKIIDESAFYGCTGLEKVSIAGNPDMEQYAFQSCSNLKEVDMPNYTGKNRHDAYVGPDAFNGCTSLKIVNMPKIQHIGERMFLGCTSLEEFKWTKNLKKVGTGAFLDTGIKKIDLPSTLDALGDYAFSRTKISTLIIPYSVVNKYNKRDISIGELTNCDIYVVNPDTTLRDVSQTCTIHGFKNSKAYESAKEMGIRFVEIKGGISSAKGKKSGAKSVLSWKKAKGAKSYTIYRYNSSKGVWQKIATTKKTKYTDKSKSAGNKYRVTYTFKQGGKTLTGGIDIDI